jgi:hypothetical protein
MSPTGGVLVEPAVCTAGLPGVTSIETGKVRAESPWEALHIYAMKLENRLNA